MNVISHIDDCEGDCKSSKLKSDRFLKEYFRSKPSKTFVPKFRKGLQSQYSKNNWHFDRTRKRTCTDQFYGLSQQCFEVNEKFEEQRREEEHPHLNYSCHTAAAVRARNEQIKQRKPRVISQTVIRVPEKVCTENQEIRGKFRFIQGNVVLLSEILQQNGFQQLPALSSLSNHQLIKNQSCDLIWCCSHLKTHLLGYLSFYQKINFFPHSFECTRKDALARNFNAMIQAFGKKPFSFMPECFIWPKEKDELRISMSNANKLSLKRSTTRKVTNRKIKIHQFLERINENFPQSSSTPWIVKPAGGSQGKGIFIVQSYEEIEKKLISTTEQKEGYIVERYLNNPLLIDQRKFDLRIYVLVTSFHPLTIYVHREGLVRRASEKYDPSCFESSYSHLTNYSVNKKNKLANLLNRLSQYDVGEINLGGEDEDQGVSEHHQRAVKFPDLYTYPVVDGMNIDFRTDFGFDEFDFQRIGEQTPPTEEKESCVKVDIDDVMKENQQHDNHSDGSCSEDRFGLKMSFAQFNIWMHENSINPDFVWEKIEDLIIKTLIVVEGKVNTAMSVSQINPSSCFELFGFDVLIDNELQPWLMEVNFAPALSTDSILDYQVKGRLLLDILNVVGLKMDVNPSQGAALPATWASATAAAKSGHTKRFSARNEKCVRFNFCGFYHNQLFDFSTPSSEREHYAEDKDKIKSLNRWILDSYYRKFVKSELEKKALEDFLLEKERSEETYFRLIFPQKTIFPNYSRYFTEERTLNVLVGRYEFFRWEFSKYLDNHRNPPRSHFGHEMEPCEFCDRKRSNGHLPNVEKCALHPAFSKFGKAQDLMPNNLPLFPGFQDNLSTPEKEYERIWICIQNRWARSMGKKSSSLQEAQRFAEDRLKKFQQLITDSDIDHGQNVRRDFIVSQLFLSLEYSLRHGFLFHPTLALLELLNDEFDDLSNPSFDIDVKNLISLEKSQQLLERVQTKIEKYGETVDYDEWKLITDYLQLRLLKDIQAYYYFFHNLPKITSRIIPLCIDPPLTSFPELTSITSSE